MLEPYEGKLSRTVLRGERDSNVPDLLDRPSDLQQRIGRIERQGNQNSVAHVFNYVTKGSFDAYLYQTLEAKQRFIGQIMTSKTPARTCEDVDQQALNYSEIKALCTGDERIKEKMMLDNEVKELNLLKAEHTNTVFDMQQTVAATPAKIENAETRLENLKADREILRQLPIDEETKLPVFRITIDGTEYTDRKEAAQALEDTVLDFVKKSSDSEKEIGEFQGFKLSVKAAMEAKKNAPEKQRTCYFERAKLKKEAFKDRQKTTKPKERSQDKNEIE